MDKALGAVIVVGILFAASSLSVAAPARGESVPVLPIASSLALLTNLSAPVLSPGGSGPLSFVLTNPLGQPITSLTLTFDVYAFVAFPGNATSAPPNGASPFFSGGNANGSETSIAIASLAPGTAYQVPGDLSITILAPAGTPSGTFALRVSLAFSEGGQSYRLYSRGYFSAAQWENATTLPDGQPTLNDTRLGVSGVLPETAVLVRSNGIPPILYAILGGSAVLAAMGGYLAWRRGPGSKSGRWTLGEPHKAPRAFGNKRSKEGD